MLRSFLLISLRNILRNRGASYLNVVGLTVGMAACLFLFNYIRFELSYDAPVGKKELWRLETAAYSYNVPQYKNAFTSPLAGPALATSISAFRQYTRIVPFSESGAAFFRLTKSDSGTTRVFIEKTLFAENSFFDVFDVEILQGDKVTALSQPNTLMLSQSTAERIFPSARKAGASVLGKKLSTGASGLLEDSYTIVGVFKDRPGNTHLKCDALLALSSPAAGVSHLAGQAEENTYTYFVAPEKGDIRQLEAKATSVFYPNQNPVEERRLSLRPVPEIHFSTETSNEPESSANIMLLLFLGVVGIIILVLACTNYINNAIINAIERAKEIGIRKLLGIRPAQLAATFIGEALLVNMLAGFFAFLLFVVGTRLIVMHTNIEYPQGVSSGIGAYVVFVVVMLFVSTLLSSVYPAIYLSALKPIDSLRGRSSVMSAGQFNKGSYVIRALLVFQLATSIIFLSSVYIVYSQLMYMERHENYSMELKVSGVFPGAAGANEIFTQKVNRFLESIRLNGQPDDIEISNLHHGRIKTMQKVSFLVRNGPAGADTSTVFNFYVIDHRYWQDSSSLFVAGKNFRPDMGDDYNSVILNEAALSALGFRQADSAVGERIESKGGPLYVRGVVGKNGQHSTPAVYVTGYRYPAYFELNLRYPGLAGETVGDFLQKTEFMWNTQFPGFYLQRRGYEDNQHLEQSMLRMFMFFSALAMLIANMGMFGLASYIAQKRSKEIGIRKIMGAKTLNIMLMLLSDFLRLVFFGCMIATPLIFYGAQTWLQSYPYRIDLAPGLIFWPVMLILTLSTCVIAEKCWKTAVKSPLLSLEMT